MEMNEENTFTQRLKRYADLGTSLGGPTLSLALTKILGIPLDAPQHALTVTTALGNLKGPLVKIAQLLASIPGFLPDEYATQLMSLQSNAPPMGPLFLKRRMANELGLDWQQHFSQFEQNAIAAASLGQVHKAQDLHGNSLAVKLQYPNMLGIVSADLAQVKGLVHLYEKYDGTLDHQEIFQEITERLLEELDYSKEAEHIRYFKKMLQDEAGIHIPQVYPQLSTNKLLTMSWQDGVPLLDMTGAPIEIRNEIAKNLFHAWYKPFYHYGILHGDPHLGNYKISPGGEIHLLDFGCVRVFPASFIGGVIKLYRALQNNDADLAISAYQAWGFQNLSKDLIEVLNLWARFLYEPLLKDEIRVIRSKNTAEEGKRILGEIHKAMKKLGPTCPPKEFVFVDRSAIALGSAFMRLEAQLNWHQMFESLIEGFSEEVVKEKQEWVTGF